MKFKKFSIVTVDEVLNIVQRLIDENNWKRDIKELHMHNTYIPNHSHFYSNLEKYGEDTYVMMQESMERSHKNRGFIARGDIVIDGKGSDWGYKTEYGVHLTIFPDGLIGIGRDFNEIPCSISGHNSHGLATEIIGNFDIGNDKFEGQQMLTFIKLYAGLSQALNLDISEALVLHNEYSSKTCPGTSISKGLTVKRIQRYIDNTGSPTKQNDESENSFLTSDIFSDIMEIGFDFIDNLLTKKDEEIKQVEKVEENAEKGDDEVAFTLSKEKTKHVQSLLSQLGYDIVVDGIYGADTTKKVRQAQIDYNIFPIDGKAGNITIGELEKEVEKLNKTTEEPTTNGVAIHRYIGTTHIVELDPLDVRMHIEQTSGRNLNIKNAMNASFVGFQPDGKAFPLSTLVAQGELKSNFQPNGRDKYPPTGIKTPTFIIYKSGKVAMKDVSNIYLEENINDIWFAVSGVQTKPYRPDYHGFNRDVGIDPKTVIYETHRGGIGYRANDNKVILIYKPSSTADRQTQTWDYLDVDFGLSTDSGGSTVCIIDGKKYFTTSRQLYAFITWEVNTVKGE